MTLKLNTFHEGDCLELMHAIPSATVDLVITSPPYNLKNSTGGGMRSGASFWQNATLRDGYDDHDDDMPRPEYVAWQRACLTEMMRVLRDDGAIFYNHKRRVQAGLLEDPGEIVDGFPVRQIIVWQRAGGINFNPGYFLPTYEVIYLIAKPGFLLHSPDPARPKAASTQGDVWTVPQQDGSNKHPAPFPLEIPLRCIESTDAQVVLDPFVGSGTTALAAEMLGRAWIGIDKAPKYVEMAEARLAEWRALTPEQKKERLRKIRLRGVETRIRGMKRKLCRLEDERGRLIGELDPEE